MAQEQLLFGAVAVVLVGLGMPMAQRRVKPNRWYGFRIPATFADEHIWYEANAMAGRDLIALGVFLALTVVVTPRVVPSAPEGYSLVWSSVLVTGSIVSTLRAWRYANRLRRERQQRGGGTA